MTDKIEVRGCSAFVSYVDDAHTLFKVKEKDLDKQLLEELSEERFHEVTLNTSSRTVTALLSVKKQTPIHTLETPLEDIPVSYSVSGKVIA